MAVTKLKTPPDPLDELANGSPLRIIQLMLWKNRHRNPDMFCQITPADIAGFDDCCQYMKVTPAVRIAHPQGFPAQPAIPAERNRRAIPAREAQPAKPFVIVALVEENTENSIRPVENNQDDYDIAQQAALIRKARDTADSLADRIENAARTGEFSMSEITDAANALRMLARAYQA